MITSRVCKYMIAGSMALMAAFGAKALNTAYYANESVLSMGRWMKIKVTEAGIHEITYDQLESWGFNPANVTVYGYGGASLADNRFSTDIPDDLNQQYSLNYPEQRKVFFYGVPDVNVTVNKQDSISVQRNFYSTAGYYFVTDSRPNNIFSGIPYVDRLTTKRSHLSLDFYENEEMNPMAGGTFFFDRSLVGNPQTLSFPIVNYDKNYEGFKGCLIYSFASDSYSGMSMTLTNVNNCFTIPLGTSYPVVPPVTTDTSRVFNLSNYKPVSVQPSDNIDSMDSWEVSFSIPTNVTSVYTYVSLDKAAFLYPRTNSIADCAQLMMYFPEVNSVYHNFRISNTGGHDYIQAWNVDNPCNVRPYLLKHDTSAKTAMGSFNGAYDKTTGAAKVAVFNPTMPQLPVEAAGIVAAQNLHGDPVPDMIILTPESLKPQAERLAALHAENQGYRVKVVTQEAIFNEFSSGTPAAHAIRRYAKMHFDRDPHKLRHLLIFGLGSWDNRHLSIPDQEYLLTYQTESSDYAALVAKCYAADSYFGMLNDEADTSTILKSEMDINVGRMPVNNISDAKVTVDKIERYFNNPPVQGSYNRALLFCDDGDSNDHLLQSDQVAGVITELSPNTTVTKCYNALYPFASNGDAVALRDAMKFYLQQGQGYWGYAGHGRYDMLGSGEVLWSLAHIDGTDYNVPPFTMLSTCNAYAYDRSSNDIGGFMIRKANGGAMNVIAACRAVYKKHNQTFNLAVSRAYFSAINGDCAGDVYRNARNSVVRDAWAGSSRKADLVVNTLCYNLAGDPALPLYVPSLGVKTISIDGVDVTEEEVNVFPLEPFTLHGAITNERGEIDTSFNGVISIDIYDGAQTIRSSAKGEANETYTSDVYVDETLLVETRATVENGYFTTTIVSPAPVLPEVANRISYYASSNDKRYAAGVFRTLNVNPYDETRVKHPDTDAPEITSVYIDYPEFVSGDETGPDIRFIARIAPDASGINVSGGKVGNGAKLVLDGSTNYQYVASAVNIKEDGSAEVDFGIQELSDGFHTLEFSISDNSGNRSARLIGFVVVDRTADASLTADNTPARTDITFDLDHSFREHPTGRIVIEDGLGNTVFTDDNCSFPFNWNLTDGHNNRVADGRYSAYAILRQGKQFGHTPRLEFVVLE